MLASRPATAQEGKIAVLLFRSEQKQDQHPGTLRSTVRLRVMPRVWIDVGPREQRLRQSIAACQAIPNTVLVPL
jgi:hypothetical protein